MNVALYYNTLLTKYGQVQWHVAETCKQHESMKIISTYLKM